MPPCHRWPPSPSWQASSDPLGLGLATRPDYRLAGPLADRLFHVGPFLKGQFWEATAVPELREHAARVAAAVAADLAAASALRP